jgi:hypothetical protein
LKLRLVVEALTAKKLVDVLFVDELFVVTRLVVVAYVLLRRVIVPVAAVRLEIVVVASVVVPVTTKVFVVVASVTTSPSINAVTAWKIEAKRFVEEALSKLAYVE